MSFIDTVAQLFKNILPSHSAWDQKAVECANRLTIEDVAKGEENRFIPNYQFCKTKQLGADFLKSFKKGKTPGTLGSSQQYTDPIRRQAVGIYIEMHTIPIIPWKEPPPQKHSLEIKIGDNFKYIDNGPENDSNRDTIGPEDAVRVQVKLKNGTWGFMGMMVKDFLFNPRAEYRFGPDLDTVEKRADFLKDATGNRKIEIRNLLSDTWGHSGAPKGLREILQKVEEKY